MELWRHEQFRGDLLSVVPSQPSHAAASRHRVSTVGPASPTKEPAPTRRPATIVTLFLTLVLLAAASLKTVGAVAAQTPHLAGWNGGSYAAWALSPYAALAILGCSVRRASIASGSRRKVKTAGNSTARCAANRCATRAVPGRPMAALSWFSRCPRALATPRTETRPC